MHEAISCFLPNRILSKGTVRWLAATWVALLLFFWFFNPVSYIPKPADTWGALNDLVDNGLARELANSLLLNLQAVAISTVLSLGLAYMTVIAAFRPVVRFIGNLRFLSMVGLSYFFARATTGGHEQKLALLTFSITVFFLVGMADVVASVPKANYDLARTLGMSEWRTVWEVVVLGTAAQAFDTLRQNAAMGWLMLTMVESTVRSEGGIGTVLVDQNHHFNMEAVMAIMIVTLILGMSQDYLIGFLRKICCPYADLRLERR